MPMSKTAVIVAILIVLAGVLAVQFNPTPEMHRARIREVVSERSPLLGAIGVGSLRAFLSNYHSIGVASYTQVGDRTVTVGAYGHVFVLDNARKE